MQDVNRWRLRHTAIDQLRHHAIVVDMESAPTILIHSSKSMKVSVAEQATSTTPIFIDEAISLHRQLEVLSEDEIVAMMHVSSGLAKRIKQQIKDWTNLPTSSAAIDMFSGDIYSGLRAASLSHADRMYAQEHLVILSGLYGALRPLDAVAPYRLEMAYKLNQKRLHDFWGDKIAHHLPPTGLIINVSSREYTRVITPYVSADRIITPQFLTVNQTTGIPSLTTVHAKIARGAFARWMITSQTSSRDSLSRFDDLNYRYDPVRSTELVPVYVCETFGGIGLSVRLA